MTQGKPKEGMDLLAKAMRKVFQEEILDPLRDDMEHMEERLTERIDSQGNKTSASAGTWGRGRRRSSQGT